MDPLDRAAAIEDCAHRWRADAARYRGTRRAWRLRRAAYLQALAESLIA